MGSTIRGHADTTVPAERATDKAGPQPTCSILPKGDGGWVESKCARIVGRCGSKIFAEARGCSERREGSDRIRDQPAPPDLVKW